MGPKMLSTNYKASRREDELAGEIIRQGDPTSHGGKVLEGSPKTLLQAKRQILL
jgi:uncharacterized Zn-binding protein involved in type VI secretion